MRKLDIAALVLVIVGALNWGLVALAEFDLVAKIFGMEFGETNAASRLVYSLVGLSGVWIAARATTLGGRQDQRTHALAQPTTEGTMKRILIPVTIVAASLGITGAARRRHPAQTSSRRAGRPSAS